MSNLKRDSQLTLFFIILVIFMYTEEQLVAQDLNDSSVKREVFTVVEEQPSYETGMDAFYSYLMKEIRYPVNARNNGIEGQVDVQFSIERNGSVSHVRVINDIGDGCGSEVERILQKLSSFTPGSQRGRTVKTVMLLSVNFILDPTKTNTDNSPHGSIVFGELEIRKAQLQLDVQYKDGTWHGILKDNEGNPLAGANIVVEGTNYGRVSDLDGTFSVMAEESQDVVISFVGYESIRLKQKE